MNKDILELFCDDILALHTDEPFLSEYSSITFKFLKLFVFNDKSIQIVLPYNPDPLVINLDSSSIVTFNNYYDPTEFYLKLEPVTFNFFVSELKENHIPIISFIK